MGEGFFVEMKQLVGFTDADSNLLRELSSEVAPHIPAITDAFYVKLLQHERTRSVLSDDRQIARLKRSFSDWLLLLFDGPHDEHYFARRWEVGRTHARIELPERYVFGAMNLIRRSLLDLLDTARAPRDRTAVRDALEKMLDIELAILAESYRINYCETIERQDRLASIGEIAASVNHELRNPLSVIGSSVYALKEKVQKGEGASEEVRNHLDKIDRSVNRAVKIASDLLRLTRECLPERKPVDLHELLQDSLALARLPATIASSIAVQPAVSRITLDPELIGRVLLNLIQNAADAMKGNGRLDISARRDLDLALIEVTDSGEGIPADDLEVIFRPLYTTKANGTGLGLSLSRNIVAAHGGSLTVRSEQGKSSTFTITMPLHAPNER